MSLLRQKRNPKKLTQKRITIDAEHEKTIKQFRKIGNTLESYKKTKRDYEKRINKIKDIEPKKRKEKDWIELYNLNKESNNISRNILNAEKMKIEYYTKTAHILFQYYESKENPRVDIMKSTYISNTNNNSIIDYFTNKKSNSKELRNIDKSKKKESDNSNNSNNFNNSNNSNNSNNFNNFNNSNNNSNNNNNVTNNINNTINNNNNNSNNNITININPFGKENIDSITEKEKIHVLNNLYLAMPQAMKMIHYDIPENRNFFISNKREKKYITVFDGTHTTYDNSIRVKDKICSKVMNYLEEWFNTYQLKLLKNKKKILGDVFNSYYDGKLNDQYFSEVEKFLLSYSADIKQGIDDTLRKIKLEKQKQR